MQKITTFLTFHDQAEQAAKFYTSLFPDSRITGITYYGDLGPRPKGTVMTVTFELAGQEFVALNGGPDFHFAMGISLMVNCETQAEIDRLWDKLSEGGAPNVCGWLTDRFGVSWQITPVVLGQMLSDPDPAKAQRAMAAMMKMAKLDIRGLEQAYNP